MFLKQEHIPAQNLTSMQTLQRVTMNNVCVHGWINKAKSKGIDGGIRRARIYSFSLMNSACTMEFSSINFLRD